MELTNLKKVISLTQRKLGLLLELEESLNEEAADYVVCIDTTFSSGTYVLVHRESNTNIDAGGKARIEKYINHKRLTKVYWRK